MPQYVSRYYNDIRAQLLKMKETGESTAALRAKAYAWLLDQIAQSKLDGVTAAFCCHCFLYLEHIEE